MQKGMPMSNGQKPLRLSMVKSLILVFLLVVMVNSALAQEFKLEYRKTGFKLHIGLKTWDSDKKFEKEPEFYNGPIVRGLLPTGKKKEDHVGFAWDRNERKLYLDLNRNRDLTDDSEGVFESEGRDRNQVFEDIHLTVPHGSGQLKYVVRLNIYSYGSNKTNCSLAVNSGFKSEIELHGKIWQLAIADNMDGKIGRGDRIFIIPLDDAIDTSTTNSQFSLPARDMLTLDGHNYDVSFELQAGENAQSLLASFAETEQTMGRLKLEGKFIKRLVLTSDSSLVLLDSPGETVSLPTGEYIWKNLFLDSGQDDIFIAVRSRRDAESFLVTEETPAVLKIGGPLNNTVKVRRTGNTLNLSYKLKGVGGHKYSSMNTSRDKAPTFTVKKGGKEVASGKFEYG